MSDNNKNQFLKRAFKHSYLHSSLETISGDDKKEIEDYTLEELVDEAEYCLTTYFESGHINNPDEDFEGGGWELSLEMKHLKNLYLDYKEYGSGKWSKHLPF